MDLIAAFTNFLWDDHKTGWQSYVLTKTAYYTWKIINVFLLATFTTGLGYMTIKIRSNNPMFQLKLHIILNILINSYWICLRTSQHDYFCELIKFFPLKLPIILNILIKSSQQDLFCEMITTRDNNSMFLNCT